jgi:GTPase
VREVLEELGAAGKPTITALNKIDLLDGAVDPAELTEELRLPPDFVPISAEARIGLEDLLRRIELVLERDQVAVTVMLPYARGELVEVFRREGTVGEIEYGDTGTTITGHLPPRLLERFRPFITEQRPATPVPTPEAEPPRTAVAS